MALADDTARPAMNSAAGRRQNREMDRGEPVQLRVHLRADELTASGREVGVQVGGDRLRAADRRGDERDGADSAIATRVAGDPLFYAARSAWWRPTDRRRTRTSTPASRSR
jgi:hypothetical protein